MSLAAGTRLGAFEVLAPIGAGAMGEVYKARDTRLNREVAVKVLPAEKVADADRKLRFIQEAKAASALNHPNIVTIFDIGNANGADYIVMELVSGKTLSQFLAPKGLPLNQALQYAVQIAEALAQAHAAAIIHRDLKPANIMVRDDGLVKVMDFGLAKLTAPVEYSDSSATATLGDGPQTEAGWIVGTAAYMSPEQAEGKRVDARSDIFAFGLVLYEMLSGQRAFQGETRISTLAAILHHDPRPLGEVAAGVPPELERIVTQCLRKDPARRFQGMADVKVALEEIRAGVTSSGSARRLAEPDPVPSIAILPFANLSADKENEYFSDGLTEEIINAMSRVPGLRVAARTSAFQFRGAQDLSRVGEQLKVRTVLEGSVRKAGNRVRITVQLVDIVGGFPLWSERYDREMTDIFAIQDEISQAIVEKLRVKLGGASAPALAPQRTDNPAAYQAYLEGNYHGQRLTPASLDKARQYYERAIQLDPDYALPHVGLSAYHYNQAILALEPPRVALPKARTAAEKALALNVSEPAAYSMAGISRAMLDHDWSGAERELDRALELDPANVRARFARAWWLLRPLGRLEEAETELSKVLEADPLAALFRTCRGLVSILRGRYDRANEDLRRVIDQEPAYYLAWWGLGHSLIESGPGSEAVDAFLKGNELFGGRPLTKGTLAAALARVGRASEARALLAELKQTAREQYIPASTMVWTHVGLGELDAAFEWVAKAVEERDPLILALGVEPSYAPLRGDPRYQAMLRQMNLA